MLRRPHLARPGAVLRWPRRRVVTKWTYPIASSAPVGEAVVSLIERRAGRITAGDPTRLQDELLPLGHRVGASTIRRVLRRWSIRRRVGVMIPFLSWGVWGVSLVGR